MPCRSEYPYLLRYLARIADAVVLSCEDPTVLPETDATHLLCVLHQYTPVTPDVLSLRIRALRQLTVLGTSRKLHQLLSREFPLIWSTSCTGKDPVMYRNAKR
jgi:hypothetical protein